MSDKSEENLVVRLPPKLSSVIKKNSNQVRFSAFFSSKQFDWCFDNSEPQNHEYEKTHAKISDSVCKDLKTWITIKTQISDSNHTHKLIHTCKLQLECPPRLSEHQTFLTSLCQR